MMLTYDNKCRECESGLKVINGEEVTCKTCEGYGYLLTFEGFAVIEFLKRRGFAIPMSPQAEEELRGMVE